MSHISHPSTLFQVRRNEAACLTLTSSAIGRLGATVMLAKARGALRTAWPLVVLGFAVVINGVWIVALGYAIFKFLWPAPSVGILTGRSLIAWTSDHEPGCSAVGPLGASLMGRYR